MIPLITNIPELTKHLNTNSSSFTFQVDNQTFTTHHILRLLPDKRLTISGEWQQQSVVAKLFFGKFSTRYLQRELAGYQLLTKAHILTPAILYQGTCGISNTALIIFSFLTPDTLSSHLWKSADINDTRSLLYKIQQVLLQQHAVGIFHTDLHPANFLLHKEQIYTLDGAAIAGRISVAGLSISASIKNLAAFYAQLASSKNELILPAFHQYCATRFGKALAKLDKQLSREVSKARHVRLNKFFRRLFRNCSDFIAKKTWHFHYACQRTSAKQIQTFFSNIDSVLAQSEIIKNGNTCTVFKIRLEGCSYIVKRYNIKNFWHFLTHCWRKSRAEKSWRNANMLELYSIPTAKPIAFLERRFGWLRLTSYFVCDYIDGLLLNEISQTSAEHKLYVEKALRLMQMLANLQVSHGDTKATNFIVKDEQVYFLDLDSMRLHHCKYSFKKAWQKDCDRFKRNWKTNAS